MKNMNLFQYCKTDSYVCTLHSPPTHSTLGLCIQVQDKKNPHPDGLSPPPDISNTFKSSCIFRGASIYFLKFLQITLVDKIKWS